MSKKTGWKYLINGTTQNITWKKWNDLYTKNQLKPAMFQDVAYQTKHFVKGAISIDINYSTKIMTVRHASIQFKYNNWDNWMDIKDVKKYGVKLSSILCLLGHKISKPSFWHGNFTTTHATTTFSADNITANQLKAGSIETVGWRYITK